MHIVIINTIHALLLLYSATTATVVTGDIPLGECDKGEEDADLATVVMLKGVLIEDLANNVPITDDLSYCDTVDWEGVKMYGFAKCKPHPPPPDGSPVDLHYCSQCLGLVGTYLNGNCEDTGVGRAWDGDGSCYYKIGFSEHVCDHV
ncbi:hypothetical protein LINGRAHAP2_LOCUS33510 [Linum grandiflorum]